MRNKVFAGLLALFFGFFGVHRFYLGQRPLGIFHFILAVGMLSLTIATDLPFVVLPALMGFLDALIFLSMPKRDFDAKYNKIAAPSYDATAYAPMEQPADDYEFYKKSGINNFRNYRYEAAAADFEQALEFAPHNAALHFNLACTYSILEDPDPAFYHLEEAVELGFKQLEKIHEHDALAFLRAQPEFDAFMKNDYRRPAAQLPKPQEEDFVLDSTDVVNKYQSVLDQIVELGKLRDKGILTNEEFAQQKRKLLSEH